MGELEVWHDSHQQGFRAPFGAVPCGTDIILRFAAYGSRCEHMEDVRLCIARDGEPAADIRMAPVQGQEPGRLYEVRWTAPEEPGLWWYYFRIAYDGSLFYYGNNAQGMGGVGESYPDVPPGYQITVYRAEAATPDWIKNGVMYQIFVDRFRNGLPEGRVLNPKPGSLLHAHWNSLPLYIRDPETKRVIRWDFYGGNLYGILEKLPYLKSLGVTVLYLNPIFEASSNHKYDTGDYHKIDPMFGDNELFASLCAEARRFGIRIVLDGVFSHTGSDSLYFNREGNYASLGAYQGRESPYYEWYRFVRHPDDYECWWGIDVLPNVEEMNPSYQDFIMHNENSVVKHWHRLGASGWRLDVADELPDAFICAFRRTLKEADPDAVLIGEVWEDATNKISYGVRRKYLLGDELDSVMNYPFRRIALDFLLGRADSAMTHRALMSLYENYPRPHFYSLMNLIGSHDVPRALTVLQEELPASAISQEERRALAMKRLKLLVLWKMTFPGMPCVYYGDEAGMEGGDDPANRGPYPWGEQDGDLLAWYRRVIRWRHAHNVLRTGTWESLVLASSNVYGYVRKLENETDVFGQPGRTNTALVLLNRSLTQTVEIEIEAGSIPPLYDVTGNGEAVEAVSGKIRAVLPPLSGRLLLAYHTDTQKQV